MSAADAKLLKAYTVEDQYQSHIFQADIGRGFGYSKSNRQKVSPKLGYPGAEVLFSEMRLSAQASQLQGLKYATSPQGKSELRALRGKAGKDLLKALSSAMEIIALGTVVPEEGVRNLRIVMEEIYCFWREQEESLMRSNVLRVEAVDAEESQKAEMLHDTLYDASLAAVELGGAPAEPSQSTEDRLGIHPDNVYALESGGQEREDSDDASDSSSEDSESGNTSDSDSDGSSSTGSASGSESDTGSDREEDNGGDADLEGIVVSDDSAKSDEGQDSQGSDRSLSPDLMKPPPSVQRDSHRPKSRVERVQMRSTRSAAPKAGLGGKKAKGRGTKVVLEAVGSGQGQPVHEYYAAWSVTGEDTYHQSELREVLVRAGQEKGGWEGFATEAEALEHLVRRRAVTKAVAKAQKKANKEKALAEVASGATAGGRARGTSQRKPKKGQGSSQRGGEGAGSGQVKGRRPPEPTRAEPATPERASSPEEFWGVTAGKYPGVYSDRLQAQEACPDWSRVKVFTDFESARFRLEVTRMEFMQPDRHEWKREDPDYCAANDTGDMSATAQCWAVRGGAYSGVYSTAAMALNAAHQQICCDLRPCTDYLSGLAYIRGEDGQDIGGRRDGPQQWREGETLAGEDDRGAGCPEGSVMYKGVAGQWYRKCRRCVGELLGTEQICGHCESRDLGPQYFRACGEQEQDESATNREAVTQSSPRQQDAIVSEEDPAAGQLGAIVAALLANSREESSRQASLQREQFAVQEARQRESASRAEAATERLVSSVLASQEALAANVVVCRDALEKLSDDVVNQAKRLAACEGGMTAGSGDPGDEAGAESESRESSGSESEDSARSPSVSAARRKKKKKKKKTKKKKKKKKKK